jgi:hypothetical protein
LRESFFFSLRREALPAEGRRKEKSQNLGGFASLRESFFLISQSRKGAKKAREVKPLRLCALPAVDRLCVSTFFNLAK